MILYCIVKHDILVYNKINETQDSRKAERVKGEFIFKCKQMGDTSHLYKNNEPDSNSGLYEEFYNREELD